MRRDKAEGDTRRRELQEKVLALERRLKDSEHNRQWDGAHLPMQPQRSTRLARGLVFPRTNTKPYKEAWLSEPGAARGPPDICEDSGKLFNNDATGQRKGVGPEGGQRSSFVPLLGSISKGSGLGPVTSYK